MQQNLLLNANGTNTEMVSEQKLLKTVATLAEDEGGEAASSADTYTEPVSTKSTDIASQPQRVGNRVVVKRKRNPEVVKRLTMKFPDTRKTE